MAYIHVRKVPEDWRHPKDEHGRYIALLPGYYLEESREEWEELVEEFEREGRTRKEAEEHVNSTQFTVKPEDYMPQWDESKLTHFQLYEDTSEGTPVSPVMSIEEYPELFDAFIH